MRTTIKNASLTEEVADEIVDRLYSSFPSESAAALMHFLYLATNGAEGSFSKEHGMNKKVVDVVAEVFDKHNVTTPKNVPNMLWPAIKPVFVKKRAKKRP